MCMYIRVQELQRSGRRARIALKGEARTQARRAGFAATRSEGVWESFLDRNGRLGRSTASDRLPVEGDECLIRTDKKTMLKHEIVKCQAGGHFV
jgi:hypothetical protein